MANPSSATTTSMFNISRASVIPIFYTVLIFVNNFAWGMTINIIGAVMTDLRYIYSTTQNTISYIQVCVGIGYLIGSLAAVIGLYRIVNRQIALSFFVLAMAITVGLLPRYPNLITLFAMTIVDNIGGGAWDSSTSIWIVEMWPTANSAILQGNQFMFGVGSIVAPLLASPFVYGAANHTGAQNRSITIDDRINSLSIPFGIIGASQAFVPLILLINFMLCRYERKNSIRPLAASGGGKIEKTISEANSTNNGNDKGIEIRESIPYRFQKLIMIGFVIATYISGELGYFSFVSSMLQHSHFGWSAHQADLVQSIVSSTYTFGRLITAFVSLKLSPDIILAYHYVIVIGSLIFIYIGGNNHTIIFIGNAILGFGYSAIWPGIYAFTQYYLRLTDKVCSFYSFLSGVSIVIIPLVMSQVSEKYPLVLLYLTAGFTALSMTLFFTVRAWIYFQPATSISSIPRLANNNNNAKSNYNDNYDDDISSSSSSSISSISC